MFDGNLGASVLDGTSQRLPLPSGTWVTIRMDVPVDEMSFWPDGTVTIDGRDFSPGMLISNCSFGERLISKTRGESIDLLIMLGDDTHKYRFDRGQWYKWGANASTAWWETWKQKCLLWLKSPGMADFDRWALQLRMTCSKYWKRIGVGAVILVALTTVMQRWRAHVADEPLRQLERRTAEIRALNATLSKEERELNSTEATVKAKMEAIQEQLESLYSQESGIQNAEREKAEAAVARDQQISLYRSAFQELQREGEHLLEQHDSLVHEMKEWQTTIPPLLTNDLGRQLASNEANIRTFLKIYKQPRSPAAVVQSLRVELEEILRPIRRSAQREDLAAGPLDDVNAALRAKGEQIAQIHKEYQESRELLQSLAARAPRSDMTLQVAIDSLAAKDAEQQAQLILEQTRDERQRLNQAAALTKEQELEAATEAAESERLAEEAEFEDEQAHAQAIAKAKRKEVRKALSFFTTQAYSQPYTDGANTGLVMTGEKGPISLSRLQQVNALEASDPNSLSQLLYVLRSPVDADRHPWPYAQSTEVLSARKLDELRKIQTYLNELGPALVELKLLAE